jgi:uncharacterized flavoprotein (TIGR03862 family)
MSAHQPSAIVIGAGPAGLMAAETLAQASLSVSVFDRMPSPARRFLMAGRGGLNLTHGEPLDRFLTRYREAEAWLRPAIRAFAPEATIAWAESLGQPVFTGSSLRVFPRAMKASPLLRAWLRRLDALGVSLRPNHRFVGWAADGSARFATPAGERVQSASVTILALGGASWPRLGADPGWADLFPHQTTPFRPANCGFHAAWSEHFRARAAGLPLHRVEISVGPDRAFGEVMVTTYGLEGGAIYALSALIRDTIARDGAADIHLDLRPDLTEAMLRRRLADPGSRSLSTLLRARLRLPPQAVALIQEARHRQGGDPADLVKRLPLRLTAAAGIARAISSAGGLRRDAVDGRFMLRDRPSVFVAGEMLDWEAPTGGYLLQACFATGVAAAQGALAWLRESPGS